MRRYVKYPVQDNICAILLPTQCLDRRPQPGTFTHTSSSRYATGIQYGILTLVLTMNK